MKIKPLNTQSFGLAKIANKTPIWEVVNAQMQLYPVSREIMNRNFKIINRIFPKDYLHTYELDDKVIFKITKTPNHFLSMFIPAKIKYTDKKINNTPIGIFTGFKQYILKTIEKHKQTKLKNLTK